MAIREARDINLHWSRQTHPVSRKPRLRPRTQIIITILLIAAAFPVRFSFVDRTISMFDIAIVAAFAPWLVVILLRKVKPPRAFAWLGLVSILLAAGSILWSPAQGETMLYVFASVESIVVFMMAITFLQDAPPQQIVRLISIWVFLLLIPAALLWLRVPGFLPPDTLDPSSGDYISYFARLSHPFIGRSNNLAALLVVLIIPLAAWAVRTGQRVAGWAAFVALGAVALTLSRGTLLALGVAVVAYLLIDHGNARRLFNRGIGVLLIIGGIGYLLINQNDIASEFFSGRLSNVNVDSRSALASRAQQVIEGNWFVGVGAGVGEDTHNTFIQQLVYFGLIGGLLVSVLLVSVTVSWFVAKQEKWLATAIGIGVLAQMGSFVVESSYEGTLLRPLIWFGWGLLVAWWRAQVSDPVAPATSITRPIAARQGVPLHG